MRVGQRFGLIQRAFNGAAHRDRDIHLFCTAWMRKSSEILAMVSVFILGLFHLALLTSSLLPSWSSDAPSFLWMSSAGPLLIMALWLKARQRMDADPLWFYVPVMACTIAAESLRIHAHLAITANVNNLPIIHHMVLLTVTTLALAIAPTTGFASVFLLGMGAFAGIEWAWSPVPQAWPLLLSSLIAILGSVVFHFIIAYRSQEEAVREFHSRKRLESLEKERLDVDLAIARRIQDSLSPATASSFSRFETKLFHRKFSQVGGDWAAFRQEDNGDLYVLVADAAGKGIQAALVIHAVQSLWAESLGSRRFDPEEWLHRVNRALCQLGSKKPHMVTVGLAKFSHDSCTYWSAGHVPLFLLTNGDDQPAHIKVLLAPGTPLGLIAQVTLGKAQASIGSHFAAFMGSDGYFKTGSRQRRGEFAQLQTKLRQGDDIFANQPAGGDDQTLIWIAPKVVA